MSNTPSPARHTPGPWEARKLQEPSALVDPEHGWGVIAVRPMRGRIDSSIQGMREANARLIAAAPELYEVMQECLLLFAKDHALDRFDWSRSALRAEDIRELNELPLKIRAVLAKPEGTSEPAAASSATLSSESTT